MHSSLTIAATLLCYTAGVMPRSIRSDLCAYGRFSAWRASVLLALLADPYSAACLRACDGFEVVIPWPVDLPEAQRQIQEQGVLRSSDPDSESEAEVLEDPCQAVQVGLELQGVVKAVAAEDCGDRTAAGLTQLLEKDRELSDLGGSHTARLCNHHSQLYMMLCQSRKCSVISCYGALHALCGKHLAEAARSLSPASTGPRIRVWCASRCRRTIKGLPLSVGKCPPAKVVPTGCVPPPPASVEPLTSLWNNQWRFRPGIAPSP